MEKPLKPATNSGNFFVGSAKREYNSDVTKKNKQLRRNIPCTFIKQKSK